MKIMGLLEVIYSKGSNVSVSMYELNFIAIGKLNIQQSVSKLERVTQESFILVH